MEPDEEPGAPIRVHISDLPDAIDVATYERNKHILIVDNAEGMASRFLRYQRGCYLLFHKQESMIVESLRLSFLQAAAHVPKMLCLRPPNLSLVSPHEACKYTTRILQNDAA